MSDFNLPPGVRLEDLEGPKPEPRICITCGFDFYPIEFEHVCQACIEELEDD